MSLMLMTKSTGSNPLTLVKPWSTWVITSKTSSTITDPLNKVNTHWWSKLGQNPGQTPLSLDSLRNFCRVLKHSKIS
jgi:hypothetical protein